MPASGFTTSAAVEPDTKDPLEIPPHDVPNHSTVHAYNTAWRDEGIVARLNYDLTGLARVKEGRKPEPAASVIDTAPAEIFIGQLKRRVGTRG